MSPPVLLAGGRLGHGKASFSCTSAKMHAENGRCTITMNDPVAAEREKRRALWDAEAENRPTWSK
jgi:hypothetical protein